MDVPSVIRKFYKYRPWDEYSREIISKNELWFSAPIDFNDPFDCQFPIIPDTNPKIALEFIQHQLKKKKMAAKLHGNKSSVKFYNLALKEITMWSKERILKFWETDHAFAEFEVLNNSSVYCLSETNDNLLMWSHYAEGHRGVCFEFTYTLENSLGNPEKVVYPEDYPVQDYNDYYSIDNESLVMNTIFTKSNHWSYEQEWRIFEFRKSKGIHKFPEKLLTGIIIGCKASDKIVNELKEFSQQRPMLKLYKAHKEFNSYKLSIKAFND